MLVSVGVDVIVTVPPPVVVPVVGDAVGTVPPLVLVSTGGVVVPLLVLVSVGDAVGSSTSLGGGVVVVVCEIGVIVVVESPVAVDVAG